MFLLIKSERNGMPHFFDRKETGRKETPLPRFSASRSCNDFTSRSSNSRFYDVFSANKIGQTVTFNE